MSVIREEQHKNETDIYLMRHEGGVRAVRTWLFARQERINTEWIGLQGDDLIRMQGEARVVARMIKLIEVGPALTGGVPK